LLTVDSSHREKQRIGMENPPNQTIYINNLNEKVKKEGECWKESHSSDN